MTGWTPWTCWWSPLWFHMWYLSQLGLCSCISWKFLKYLLRTWFPWGFRRNQIEKLWSKVTSVKSSHWTSMLWCLEGKKSLFLAESPKMHLVAFVWPQPGPSLPLFQLADLDHHLGTSAALLKHRNAATATLSTLATQRQSVWLDFFHLLIPCLLWHNYFPNFLLNSGIENWVNSN